MRKVFLSMTMTLDGYFCGPNGELDWMSPTPDQELNDDLVAFFQGFDQGFIGYPTASGMIPYWLGVAQNPAASREERAIAQAVNTLHPFILSNREEKLAWENTELLMVHPVANGNGQSVFANKVSLELVSVKTYQSSAMRMQYRPR